MDASKISKIYLAGPLFTEGERSYLDQLRRKMEEAATKLGKPVSVIWPWELISSAEIEALGDAAKAEVFRRCRDAIDESDLIVALLDGSQVDDGTSWEVGYGHARGKAVIGIRTDYRMAGDLAGATVNLMIDCSCSLILRSTPEFLRSFAALALGATPEDVKAAGLADLLGADGKEAAKG